MNDYIKIKNKDGKIWILPRRILKISLNLYQPSSTKGKVLKKFLPIIDKTLFIKKVFYKFLDINYVNYKFDKVLFEQIKKLFLNASSEEIYCSVFLGTPGIDQKMTVQVSDSNRILGYCKVSDKEHLIEKFKYEKELLFFYEKMGVSNIPRCSYFGVLNGNGLFVQTTIKTQKSKIVHELNNNHYEFIKKFCDMTEIKSEYFDTDYYYTVSKLKEYYGLLESLGLNVDILDVVEREVNNYLSTNAVYSAFHGDFTPWNTFFEKSDLFVFDFEYSKLKMPKYIDLFHFFTQVLIYEKKMNEYAIYEYFKNIENDDIYNNFFGDVTMYYKIYLLYIIAFYVDRDVSNIKSSINNIAIWINLLELLNK